MAFWLRIPRLVILTIAKTVIPDHPNQKRVLLSWCYSVTSCQHFINQVPFIWAPCVITWPIPRPFIPFIPTDGTA